MKRQIIVTLILIAIALVLILWPIKSHAAQIEAGLEIIKQTTEERSYSFAFAHEWKHAHLDMDYSYAESDGERYLDQGRLTYGYDFKISRKWSIWADESLGYDKVAGILMENFIGAGPKYTIYQSDAIKTSVSFGYLQHNQDWGEWYVTKRWSLRGVFKWTGNKAEAGIQAMYQPAIDESEDYISMGGAYYQIDLSESLSLKASIEAEYRSAEEARKLVQTMNLVYRMEGE